VPISNIQFIAKGAQLNFAMGATLHRYATDRLIYISEYRYIDQALS